MAPNAFLQSTARHRMARHRIAWWLGVAYLVALALIAFWPTPVDRAGHESLQLALSWLHAHGAPGWLTYSKVEFASNIVLFIPAGMLVVILTGPRRWWLGTLAGFAASGTIELGQLVLLPARVASPRDVVANTSGAVIGTILALIVFGAMAVSARRARIAAPRVAAARVAATRVAATRVAATRVAAMAAPPRMPVPPAGPADATRRP